MARLHSLSNLFPVLILALFAVTAPASQLELVTNGAFEQQLHLGWTVTTQGDQAVVWLDPALDEDPDQELGIDMRYKYCEAEVAQTFFLPTVNARVTVRLRAIAASSGAAEATAGLRLEYLDQRGEILGRSVFIDWVAANPWPEGPRCRVTVLSQEIWEDLAIDLAAELADLPAVPAADIRRLRLIFFAQRGDDC